MISACLVGDEQALERLRALPEAVNSRLLCAITRLGIDLQADVQEDKLNGQVLKSRSGSLRSSIDFRVDQSGNTFTASVFTDSRYAAAQEYGFVGTVSVRAYDRRMNLPERSFLRFALKDMTPAIHDGVEAALADAVSQ